MQRALQQSRGTSAEWWNVLTATSYSLTKGRAKSWTWGGIMSGMSGSCSAISILETALQRRLWVGPNWTQNQQHAHNTKKASIFLDCIRWIIVSRSRQIILLLYSAQVRPHLEHCVHFWVPQYKRDGAVGASPTKNYQEDLWVEKLSCDKMLREQGLSSLEKGKPLQISEGRM